MDVIVQDYVMPTSWTDKDMNWDDPDTRNPDYYNALLLALNERLISRYNAIPPAPVVTMQTRTSEQLGALVVYASRVAERYINLAWEYLPNYSDFPQYILPQNIHAIPTRGQILDNSETAKTWLKNMKAFVQTLRYRMWDAGYSVMMTTRDDGTKYPTTLYRRLATVYGRLSNIWNAETQPEVIYVEGFYPDDPPEVWYNDALPAEVYMLTFVAGRNDYAPNYKRIFDSYSLGYGRGIHSIGTVEPGDTFQLPGGKADDATPSRTYTPDVRYSWNASRNRWELNYTDEICWGFEAQFFVDINGENSTLNFK